MCDSNACAETTLRKDRWLLAEHRPITWTLSDPFPRENVCHSKLREGPDLRAREITLMARAEIRDVRG